MPIFRPLPRVSSGVVQRGRVILARRILRATASGLEGFTALRFSRLARNFTRTEVVRLFRATANLIDAGFFAESLPVNSRQLLRDIPIVSDLGERGEERITYAVQLSFSREEDIEEERLVYVFANSPLSRFEAKAEAVASIRKQIARVRRRTVDGSPPLGPISGVESEIIFVGRRF